MSHRLDVLNILLHWRKNELAFPAASVSKEAEGRQLGVNTLFLLVLS